MCGCLMSFSMKKFQILVHHSKVWQCRTASTSILWIRCMALDPLTCRVSVVGWSSVSCFGLLVVGCDFSCWTSFRSALYSPRYQPDGDIEVCSFHLQNPCMSWSYGISWCVGWVRGYSIFGVSKVAWCGGWVVVHWWLLCHGGFVVQTV